MKEKVTNRFLDYVKVETTSDDTKDCFPSTEGQITLANILSKELKSIGLDDIEIDENGYLYATLKSNSDKHTPTIGFIAHYDTSPDMSGKNVNPKITYDYKGEDIVLNKDKNIVLLTKDFPELKEYIGQDIITTDGTTLLGADDKAGIAEIITVIEYLKNNPNIKHGKVRIAFTPDEEIGRGAHRFNIKKFGCDWAYTIDGGKIGELEYENFNAAYAKITFKGRNVHPGYAKGKMINAIKLAYKYISLIPENDSPENTEGYQGFYHLIELKGEVEKAEIEYIIRDHNRELFEKRKAFLSECTDKINQEIGYDCCRIEIKDQYYNMKEKIEPVKYIVDIAYDAMKECGVIPIVKPIRGGTDGAQLSYKGLPCPNIFAGGINFHSRFEFISIQSMEKATKIIIKIIENTEKHFKK